MGQVWDERNSAAAVDYGWWRGRDPAPEQPAWAFLLLHSNACVLYGPMWSCVSAQQEPTALTFWWCGVLVAAAAVAALDQLCFFGVVVFNRLWGVPDRLSDVDCAAMRCFRGSLSVRRFCHPS